MKTHTRLLTALVATAFLAAPFAGAQADAEGPRASEQADKLVLANDHVTAWFHGKKPFLKVFPAHADENATEAFSLRFHRLVEFADDNGDGTADENEVRAFLNLQAANAWNVTLVEDEHAARINLTLVDAVKLRGPARGLDVSVPTRDANVTLVFHVFKEATTLTTGTGENVTVPAGHVKYDLVVDAWPWLDADAHRLALDLVTSANVTDVPDAPAAAVTDANGTAVGALTWATTAEAVDADGTARVVNVTASVDAAENASADAEDANLTRVSFAFDAPGFRSLVHDPTIGLASTSAGDGVDAGELGERLRDVPAPGALVALGVAVTGAVALARRD